MKRHKIFLAALALMCVASPAVAANEVRVERAGFTGDGVMLLPRTQRVTRASFDCRGTFGGGTLTAQVSVNGSDFVDAAQAGTPITCTSDCTQQLLSSGMGPYRAMRLSLAGSSGPSLSCTVLLGE